jgi:hypothetical protein
MSSIHKAQADDIQSLESYRNRSIPTFLIIHVYIYIYTTFLSSQSQGGVLVNMVRGANSPLIESIIREQVERYKSGTDPVPVTIHCYVALKRLAYK